MCFIWQGKIERCQNGSDTDYLRLLKMVWQEEHNGLTYQRIGRTAQQHLTDGHPRPSRPNLRIDLPRNTMAENLFDRGQVPTHHSQFPSSRHGTPISGTAQHKWQIIDLDQPSSSRDDTVVDGTAQHQRQRRDLDQSSAVRQNSRVDEQRQLPNQLSSSRRDPRVYAAVQLAQQTQGNNQLAISSRTARSDLASARAQNESHQDLPSSSGHHVVTNMKGKHGLQDSSQQPHQNDARQEDTEASTAGMGTLPPPCWDDNKFMLSLVNEGSRLKSFLGVQDEQLNSIWGLYAKEREALAAVHTPEAEEKEDWDWIPVTENEVIEEREMPLWDEIWDRSMLGGEIQMRNILDEDETWPPKAPEEPNIWTREPGGMLSSPMLKKILGVCALKSAVGREAKEEIGRKWRSCSERKG